MGGSKRLKWTLIILIVNFLTFWYGIYSGSDLQSLGIGLSTINTPLFAYLFSETYRPSGHTHKNHNKITEEPEI